MGVAGSVASIDPRWHLARQVGRAVALGVGATALATAATTGLLFGQARQARRTIPMAEAPPPRCDGVYGAKSPGRPVTMVLLGDSSAAGYGALRRRETLGALLATGLSRRLRRPVRLHRLAVVGCLSAGLRHQAEAALEHQPDVAVILIGGNDVTNRIPPAVAVRYLVDTVRTLREAGCEVVVGTCPDLGTIEPIQPPLRWVARRWSRQLATAQTVAVVGAGGWTVSLGDLLGPRFAAEPARMFGWDRFHPSAHGYATIAAALLPTVLAALDAGQAGQALGQAEQVPGQAGQASDRDGRPLFTRRADVRSLPQAAQEAARTAGTEVSAVQVAGVGGGGHRPSSRWAQLRRRAFFGVGPVTPTDPTDGVVLPAEPTGDVRAAEFTDGVHQPEPAERRPASGSTEPGSSRVEDRA